MCADACADVHAAGIVCTEISKTLIRLRHPERVLSDDLIDATLKKYDSRAPLRCFVSMVRAPLSRENSGSPHFFFTAISRADHGEMTGWRASQTLSYRQRVIPICNETMPSLPFSPWDFSPFWSVN